MAEAIEGLILVSSATYLYSRDHNPVWFVAMVLVFILKEVWAIRTVIIQKQSPYSSNPQDYHIDIRNEDMDSCVKCKKEVPPGTKVCSFCDSKQQLKAIKDQWLGVWKWLK